MIRRGFLCLPFALATRKIAVIAHRGEHLRHIENTVPAIQAAIEAGADYVELDVRTTADGILILMHNAAFDSGAKVVDLPFAEMRGRVTTFDEALQALRPKGSLYLDWKNARADALVAALRKHGMQERTVVYGSIANLTEMARLEPALRVMPEALSAAGLRQSLRTLRPKAVAFDRRDFQDEIVQIARQANVDIFVDRLGPDDTEAAWLDAVRRGATGIQTDRPAELVALLARR
ncbi:MAG: glycerophosphodiester phosphodiesterase family protein [Acidobacteria bacterium]|nr:glycerophosphodiester phosphodiesterase family protein [Acidobacteriota bacterium]